MRIDLLEARGGLYLDHDSFVLRHLDSVRYLVITPRLLRAAPPRQRALTLSLT